MNTPLGWARANVVYDMGGLPKPGSLAEAMCVVVWRTRQQQKVAGIRAQSQASLGGEKAVEAFKDFRDLVNRVDVKDRTERMHRQLERIKDIKEIRFQPLVSTKKTINVRRVTREEAYSSIQRSLTPVTRTTPVRKSR